MNVLDQIQKNSWSLFERIPRVPFWFTCSPLLGYISEMHKLYNIGPFIGLYIFKNGDLYMYKKSGTLENAGTQLLQRTEADGYQLLNIILNDIEKDGIRLLEKSQGLRNPAVSINLRDFAQTFAELYQIHSDMWVKGQVVNLLEHGHSLLGQKLRQTIVKRNLPAEKITEIIHTLTAPEFYSFPQKEEQDLIQLAIKTESKNAIANHFKKYAFLGYEWSGPGFSEDYFKQRLELLQKEKNSELYKQGEDFYREQIQKAKQDLITKYQLTNHEVKLAKLLSRITHLKSLRVDASWFFYWSVEPYFKQLAKKNSLSLSQIQFLKPTEIIDLFSGKEIDPELANNRKKMFAIYFHDLISEEFFGSEAMEIFTYLQEVTRVDTTQVKILHGETGAPGKARGVVRVIDHSSEIGKMNKGDILVSHTTNPTLVPAMKLAAGIVADIGGVTSHAAIISRELGIPCVVGVTIATQILKDGDRVEIDANTGVITKLT